MRLQRLRLQSNLIMNNDVLFLILQRCSRRYRWILAVFSVLYDLFSVESVLEKHCGIYYIDRTENVVNIKSASCLFNIGKV